ncbi:MAG: hypothetical protein B7Z75_03740 [Acidocella sp. 20-57-95]|nr:MAG: hypothetical protein B7Z75_03740 [Acidocella sp. 20-57-95]OYV62308.1 MAG: hypothetical protein B7Z71_01725 [Acidocella sp. 21-58-7]HQT63960.1 YqgE/AlgH family protein [Acidocella sp.]HQU03249.1 YqgE/AlgH family protein [Acidocella sp.]
MPKPLARSADKPKIYEMLPSYLSSQPDASSLTGQVLIAMPQMADPRFNQSVIYLCAHTPEGAMGIVVNQPLNKPKFKDLLKQLEIEPSPPGREIRLCTGGPVENNRGFVLHSPDWTSDSSLYVDDTHLLTASLDILQAFAQGGGPEQCLMALGYAGWGPGQLDEEILQNAWLTAPADDHLLFDSDHRSKWTHALAKLRVNPAMLSGMAGRA